MPCLPRALVATMLSALAAPAVAAPERGMDPTPPMTDDAGDIPKHRLWYSNATFARVNPLGLVESLTLGWRYRLMDSDSVLFEDTYSLLGVTVNTTPAYTRGGVRAEIAPIAVWKAWATLEGIGYFGTFDQITSFPDADAVYDDDTLEALGQGQT